MSHPYRSEAQALEPTVDQTDWPRPRGWNALFMAPRVVYALLAIGVSFLGELLLPGPGAWFGVGIGAAVAIVVYLQAHAVAAAAHLAREKFVAGDFPGALEGFLPLLRRSRFQPRAHAVISLNVGATYTYIGRADVAVELFDALEEAETLAAPHQPILRRYQAIARAAQGDLWGARKARGALPGDLTWIDALLLCRERRYAELIRHAEAGEIVLSDDKTPYADATARLFALFVAFAWSAVGPASPVPGRVAEDEEAKALRRATPSGPAQRTAILGLAAGWPELRRYAETHFG